MNEFGQNQRILDKASLSESFYEEKVKIDYQKRKTNKKKATDPYRM